MIEIVTLGDPNRFAGAMGKIYMPRKFPEKFSSEELQNIDTLGEGSKFDTLLNQYNERWSGLALVKSITHFFVSDVPGYVQKIVLIKNGWQSLNDCPFERATKTNIG